MFELDPEEVLFEQFEEAIDELEEIVEDAESRDGTQYLRRLNCRIRKCDGRFYLSITWFGEEAPSASIVRAPFGWWMAPWFRTVDRKGRVVWESGLERS
jgi:hypothetical protein